MAVAFGYVRVSTLTQVTEGEGLAVQREKILGWCSYSGATLTQTFEDAGISGATTDNRPGLQGALRSALEAAEAGGDPTLVVYKLDRLGRNALDVQEAIAVLLDGGVRVVSLADGIDSASGMGAALLKLLTSILSTFAELEKETIRSRLLDGRRRADGANRKYSSEPAYGRRLAAPDSKELVPDEDELRVVARVRELREGGWSFTDIAEQLLIEDMRPRRAEKWSKATLHRIATGARSARKVVRPKRLARARAEILAPKPV